MPPRKQIVTDQHAPIRDSIRRATKPSPCIHKSRTLLFSLRRPQPTYCSQLVSMAVSPRLILVASLSCTLFRILARPYLCGLKNEYRLTEQGGKSMKYLLAVVTIVGSLIGVLLLFISFGIDSAPAQGALVAIAIGFAVIPYCITRSIELLTDERNSILRSIVSEIRSEKPKNQPLTSSIAQVTAQQNAMANPTIGKSKRETITHPEKGATRGSGNSEREAFNRNIA